MVIMTLIAEDKNIVKYSYHPDLLGKPGVIELNKNTGEISFPELAERDSENSMLYRGKSIVALMRFHEKGEYPPRHTIYWG